LKVEIRYSNLKVVPVFEKYEGSIITVYNEKSKMNKNIFGCLGISRILFNRNFDVGYLSYGFYCGQGCFWCENVEIKKINGKWKISEHYSGGIA